MKNTILFLSAIILFAVQPLHAKEKKSTEVVKIETPENVLAAFIKAYPNAEQIAWSSETDSNIQWFFADFKTDGSKKRVKYRNGNFFSIEFEVDPSYYPAKIVAYTTDSIGLNYKITRMAVEQKQNRSVYFVEVSRGKKKTLETKAFYFTLKGDFMKELPKGEVALDFIRFL